MLAALGSLRFEGFCLACLDLIPGALKGFHRLWICEMLQLRPGERHDFFERDGAVVVLDCEELRVSISELGECHPAPAVDLEKSSGLHVISLSQITRSGYMPLYDKAGAL